LNWHGARRAGARRKATLRGAASGRPQRPDVRLKRLLEPPPAEASASTAPAPTVLLVSGSVVNASAGGDGL